MTPTPLPDVHPNPSSPDGAAVVQAAPQAMKHSMPMALSITLGLLGTGFVVWIFYNLTWLILLLYVAFVIATILEAPVQYVLSTRLRHRGLATVLVMAGGLVLITVVGYLLSGMIADQVTLITKSAEQWPASIQAFLRRMAVHLPSMSAQLRNIDVGKLVSDALPAWQSLASNALSGVSLITHGIVLFFLVLYMLLEGPDQLQGLQRLLPWRTRHEATAIFEEMASAHRRWFLATFANMFATAVLTAIGLALLGVPGFLVLGIIAGLGELVPNIGPMIAALPSLLVTLAIMPDNFWHVLVMFLIVQTIQGYGISPLVMRLGVKLSVLALLVSVLIMGTLFGLMGVLVAVPLTADLMVLWRYFNARVEKDAAAGTAACPS